MLIVEFVAYLLIAFQLDSVLCVPQSQNFNGSNPYYDSYLNHYGGDNGYNNINNQNPYVTTQKSLYPTLYPTPSPQPHYAKGQYNPTPQSNYFNRNASYQNPSNVYGNGGYNSSYGWNSNFNPHTTPSSTYQPYGQYAPTTTVRPAVTTLPPFYPKGSFNQYNRTNPTYPSYNTNQYNRTTPTYPSYNTNQYNRTTPTYPSYNTNPHNQYNRTTPTYPSYNTNPHNQYNRTSPTYPSYNTNPTYPPYRPYGQNSNTLPPNTFPDNRSQSNLNQRNNNYNNSFPANNWNRHNTTAPHQYPYPSQTAGQATKNSNFHTNNNFNRSDNNYNPQLYRPSAPTLVPTRPNIDHSGVPLATFTTYHENRPIDDSLFNYDNLHRRQPVSDYQSGQFDQSSVPLAPFPNGDRAPSYDSISNVPLAPFPGRRYKK